MLRDLPFYIFSSLVENKIKTKKISLTTVPVQINTVGNPQL